MSICTAGFASTSIQLKSSEIVKREKFDISVADNVGKSFKLKALVDWPEMNNPPTPLCIYKHTYIHICKIILYLTN